MRDADSVTVVDQVLREDTHTAEFYEALTATSPTELVAIIRPHRTRIHVVRRSAAGGFPFLNELADRPAARVTRASVEAVFIG